MTDTKRLRELHAAAPDYVEYEYRGSPWMETQYATDEVKAFYEAAYLNVPLLLDEVENLDTALALTKNSRETNRAKRLEAEEKLATMSACRDRLALLAETLANGDQPPSSVEVIALIQRERKVGS